MQSLQERIPRINWELPVYGVVGTYTGGQSSASSSHLCSLSYYMAVRHGHLTDLLERLLNVSGTKCLCRIMGYCWNDFISNQRLLHETELRPVTTSIVRECQLQLYGYVARLPEVEPANRVLSVRDNPKWRRQRGWPHNSWLGKVDWSCWELLGMGRMVAWRLTWRDHHGWRRRVNDAMHPPVYASHWWWWCKQIEIK